MPTKRRPYRKILSIDGGGIRGLIPALILQEIEQRTGRRIHTLFDLIVGTSTGGILAIALTKPGKPISAKQLVALYRKRGDQIFTRSFLRTLESFAGVFGERYDQGPLEKILKRLFGTTQLKNTLCDLIITSYDIEKRTPYLFKSSQARLNPARNHLLRDVARATSAAPTYFEPLLMDGERWSQERKRRVLIDGGVFANNPTMIALSAALASDAPREEIVLCSLGTGRHSRRFPYDEAKGWGMREWARPVISVMMDGMSDSANYHAEQLLFAPKTARGDAPRRYFRFDISLPEEMDDLDNTSKENIAGLARKAKQILRDNGTAFERLIRLL